jgi:multiple sugar transport system ATP-binding protein
MVTHDQVEAMTLASRIMVMHDHVIQQIGTPLDIFMRPANLFVAQFVGATPMNVLPGALRSGKDGRAEMRLVGGEVVKTAVPVANLPAPDLLEGPWRIGLRAEHVVLTISGNGLIGIVDFVERLGEQSWVHIRLGDGSEVVAAQAGVSTLQAGDKVGVKLDGAHAHLFDAAGVAWHAPEPV